MAGGAGVRHFVVSAARLALLTPFPTHPHTQTPCPPTRSNIACNCEQTQKSIVAENALPALADLLHPDCGCSGGCREAAAWALSNLACSVEVRTQLG